MIRTDAKLARIERTKSGTVLRKAMRVRKNQPIVFFRNNSAGVLFRLLQIYAITVIVSITVKVRIISLTISLGLGARPTSEPFGCLFSNNWATMCAYGTAAMDANPYFSALRLSI